MARMYGKSKGISKSALPYRRRAPSWLRIKPAEIISHVVRLAKKGLLPSQIGVTLRDGFGIPQVRSVTGCKILRILKGNSAAPSVPEDLYYLIKKAIGMHKHLSRFSKDKDSKFRLVLTESRIHRLARYYRRVKALPASWKYKADTASALIALL